ncbi:hypothetical protein ABZY44_13620 [Streptomyces sp. NPDC006544]|uniref:hypothetical protein n=1 Tax=Streptomyces sp. NPDC006544 TaxID=3154583 RepID=UPI0033BB7669
MKHLQALGGPLYDGSVLLGRRATAWVARPRYRDLPDDAPQDAKPEQDKGAPLKRLVGLAGAGYAVAATDYTTYAVAGGALAWVVAAFMVAGSDAPERPEPVAEDNREQPASPLEALSVAEFAEHVRAAAGSAKGAHLTSLADHLRRVTGEDWQPAAVRAYLKRVQVPVWGSVRMPGRGVSTGVRLKDLPSPSQTAPPAPVVAVVVAGQDTTTSSTTTPELQVAAGEAVGMSIIPDPERPGRWMVAHHYSKEARRG